MKRNEIIFDMRHHYGLRITYEKDPPPPLWSMDVKGRGSEVFFFKPTVKMLFSIKNNGDM